MIGRLRIEELKVAWDNWDDLCEASIDLHLDSSNHAPEALTGWLTAENTTWHQFAARLEQHRDEFYPDTDTE